MNTICRRSLLLALAWVSAVGATVRGGSATLGLKLELEFAKKQYELGQPIEVKMRYTNCGTNDLAVNTRKSDRSGRLPEILFQAVDRQGQPVRDPCAEAIGSLGGGLSGGAYRLNPGGVGYTQAIVVNQWLGFDEPGVYKIIGRSRSAGYASRIPGHSSFLVVRNPVEVKSDPIEIEIIPPDDQRRRDQMAEAERLLNNVGGQRPLREPEDDQVVRARVMSGLRYLMDVRAIPLMLKGLEDPFSNVCVHARCGLVSIRDLKPVKDAVLKLIEDKTYIIAPDKSGEYVCILATADLRAQGKSMPADQKIFFEIMMRWRDVLAKKLMSQLGGLPKARQAELLTVGIALGSLPQSDSEILQRFLQSLENVPAAETDRAEYIIRRQCNRKEFMPQLREIIKKPACHSKLKQAAREVLQTLGQ
ncbi:MAG: hypothetical protein HZA88_07915 [Verrucomicrobia bacterium]|nr:hypothetical protein [Verrucomicrobiota bacterium]